MSAHCGIRPAVTPQTIRRIGINLWADEDAGKIIEGSGIKRVWLHYRNQLRRLEAVMERVQLPESMRRFAPPGERQLTLF